MIIKLKKKGILNYKKIEGGVKIDDVVFQEDFINPDKRRIKIFIKGEEVSGIINLRHNEVESLLQTIRPGMDLVKDIKKIKKR